jgi:phage shock protein C
MVCTSCQKEIAQGSNFCYHCGAKQANAGQAQAAPAAAAPPRSARKLMRSSTDKKISGVCAGVATYLDLDVTLVRVLWVLAFLCGGTGLLLYVILWIVLPVEPLYVPVATPTSPAS